MCSIADYWPRIGRIPLHRDKELGEAWLCRTSTNHPARVTKPEYFQSDEEREAAIQILEAYYKATPN